MEHKYLISKNETIIKTNAYNAFLQFNLIK